MFCFQVPYILIPSRLASNCVSNIEYLYYLGIIKNIWKCNMIAILYMAARMSLTFYRNFLLFLPAQTLHWHCLVLGRVTYRLQYQSMFKMWPVWVADINIINKLQKFYSLPKWYTIRFNISSEGLLSKVFKAYLHEWEGSELSIKIAECYLVAIALWQSL
jgi:hypothetical protein